MKKSKKTNGNPCCEFCGNTDLSKLIHLPNGMFMCDDCIASLYAASQAYDAFKNFDNADNRNCEQRMKDIPTPHEIKEYLDGYVIGQENAKKTIATAVYNHYKRIYQDVSEDDTVIEKSNILMLGPTGSGKSHIARTVAKLLDVPCTIVDATVYTEAGYVGEDIESILTRVLQAADYDVELAERSIVVIDEIDKIARKSGRNPSITKEVNGEGVQQGLLKLLEGVDVNVPPQGGRKHPDAKMIKMSTKNILFICCGAFESISDIIKHRCAPKSVGFGVKKANDSIDLENPLHSVTTDDLKDFGIIPEMLGRLPIITTLDKIDRDAMRKIMTEPKNAVIKQYAKNFKISGVELTFDDDALDYIADYAIKVDVGARGIRGIVEKILLDAMYDVPSQDIDKFNVSLDYAKEMLGDTSNEEIAA